jgi:hypothetical protein
MSEKILKFEGSLFPNAKLLIQESKRLGTGIFAWKTPNGIIYTRMLDFETIIRFKGRFIWEIINPEEMKRLGFTQESIAIQESFIQTQTGKKHTKYIEESVSEPSKMSEEEYAKWKEEQARILAKKGEGNVEIHLHSAPLPTTEKVSNVENPEEVLISNEDVRAKLIGDYEKEGLILTEEEIMTREQFNGKLHNLKIIREKGRKPPAGSVPLSERQMGQESEEGFDTYEQMIDFLRDAENSSDKEKQKEATMILEKLYLKMLESQENTGKPYKSHEEKEKPLVEQLNERARRRRKRD